MKLRFLFVLIFCLTDSIFSQDTPSEKKISLKKIDIELYDIRSAWGNYGLARDCLYNRENYPIKLENIKQAQIYVERALMYNPDYIEALYLKATILDFFLKEIDAAILIYDRILEVNHKEKRALEERALLKSRLKDYLGAKADYLLLADRYVENSKYFLKLAQIEVHFKDYNAAEAYYSQAIERGRYEETDSYYLRARLRIKMKNYKGALEDYNKIIAINSKNMSSNQYYERANVKRFLKDYAGALEDYNRALTISPFNPINYGNYFYDRGKTKSLLKDYRGAYEDYTQAIELNSALGIFYQARAYASIQMNDYHAAKADLLLASDLLPGNKEIQLDLDVLEILIRDSKDK